MPLADNRGEWMLERHAQVLRVLVEAQHSGVAFYFVRQVEHSVGEWFVALIAA